ncbi:MAG: hypothetical protein HKN73_20250 [Gemmatimonadetes bacterium]|nr:hypothetical protein [Gemmatimonadota bacterium]
MRSRFGFVVVALVGVGTTAACALPSDLSDEFFVATGTEDIVLTVGDTVRIDAAAVRGTDTVPAMSLEFISDAPTVAIVEGDGLVRAAGVGFAEVLIRVAGLQNATPATRTVRVLRDVTIDTVVVTETASPDGRTVKWGEIIQIRGIGLDPAFGNIVFVGSFPARLQSFQAGDPADLQSLDRLSVWVPVGAAEDADVLVSRFGGSTAAWPVRVQQEDILEPANDDRVVLPLTNDHVYPELAIEIDDAQTRRTCYSIFGTPPDQCFADGYRIQMPPSGEMTVVLDTDRPVSGASSTIELRSDIIGAPVSEAYTLSADWSFCIDWDRVTNFITQVTHPFSSQADSMVFAIRGDPGHPFNFSYNVYSAATPVTEAPLSAPSTSRYGLRLIDGYRSDLPPDEAEENDHCWGSHDVAVDAPPLALTFDHGRDLDWFRFTVTGVGSPIVAQADEAEPNNTAALADTVSLGTRISAEISSPSDVDHFAFFADAGQLLDIEVVTDFRTGLVTVNSFLQLWFDGEPIAFNDDISPSTPDSRITITAPETGWYTAAVQDLFHDQALDETYSLNIRALADHVRLSATVTQTSGLPDNQFVPVIRLLRDTRTTLGSPTVGRFGEGALEELLVPGQYLLLVYNRAGVAAEYTLSLADTR